MPNIPVYNAPQNLELHPTETGVESVAGAARGVGGFFNQQASAQETLARATERLSGQTQQLGRETSELGSREGSELTDVGRRVGSAITAAGDAAVKYIDHQQISKGAADWSAMLLDKTRQWQQIAANADPNDPTVGPKFIAGLEPSLDNFKSGFSTEEGQKWAEAHGDALRQHLTEMTIGTMSKLAEEAVTVNHQKNVNQLSATAYSDPSPAGIDLALAGLKSSTEGTVSSAPNMTAEAKGRVRMELAQAGSEAIVKAGYIGYIDKTGKMPPWASDPKYAPYINATEIQQFQKHAEAQSKVNALNEKALVKAQNDEATRAASAALSKSWDDNVKYDENGKAIINPRFLPEVMGTVRKYPGLVDADARAAINFVQAQQEKTEAVVSDPTVRGDFLQRLSSPDKFPTEIEIKSAVARHELAPKDGQELLAVQQAVTQRPGGEALKRDHAEFFKQYGPAIDPDMKLGFPTALGAQNIYRAEMDAYRKEDFMRQKGLDPHLLFQPNSDYFIGKPETISGYRASLADQAAYKARLKADQNRPAASPTQSTNLTGNSSTVTGIQTLDIPKDMSPADAMKWAKEKGAKTVRLPDGRIGTVQ